MLSNQIKLQQVKEWMESPVTRKLIGLISEHLAANKDELSNIILGSNARDISECIPNMTLLKGQIHTWEYLEDLESFLETKEEIEDDNLQTTYVQSDSENY